MDIRIGTSGWSYPKGRGSWEGIFYPPRGERGRGFDELTFYAERFNAVEINSTFYGQPRANVSLGWVKRTPPTFEFAVKLYQKFTHPRTSPDSTPIAPADIDLFKGGIEPLAASGRLGALLAQFPASFKPRPEAADYLDWLLTTFSEYPLAVELRHRGWSDEREHTRQILDAHGAAWVQIDEPKFGSSIRQDFTSEAGASEIAGASLLYVRLHGRNAQQWWHPEHSEDRYNYFYSERDLKPFAEATARARAIVKKAYLFLNNHFAAQSIANAAMLRHMLDEPPGEPLPAELVARYPMLAGKVPTMTPSRLL